MFQRMICKDSKVPAMRLQGFNWMYAFVLDIVAGNCFVEMQSCERASVVFRPMAYIGSGSLFEDCDRSVITTARQ